MPRAPTLDGPQVNQNALPGAYQSGAPTAESLGAGTAQGLQNLGGAAFDIWKNAQQQANTSQVNQGQAVINKKANLKEEAFKQLKQRDPSAKLNDYIDSLNADRDEAMADLTNDAQRQRLNEWYTQRAEQFRSSLSAHAANELDVAKAADLQAAKIQNINQAANNSTDPNQVMAAREDMRRVSDQYATEHGFSDIQKAELHTKDSTAFWSQVIDRHLSENRDLTAKQVFEAHKNEMDSNTSSQLGKTLEFSNSQAEAQRQATAIYAPGKTLEQMSTEADKITDQRVQAETKQRLSNMHSLHQSAVEEQSRNLYKTSLSVLNSDPRGIDAIPMATLSALNQADPERYQALVATAARMAKRDDTTTDEGNAKLILARSALSGALGEDAKNRAINDDVFKMAPILSRNDLRELAKFQDDAKVGKMDSGVRSMAEIARETLAANGEKPDPINHDGTPNKKTIAFNRQLQALIDDHRASTGKYPDRMQIQKMASGLMMPGNTVSGFFVDTVTPKYMIGVDVDKPDTYLQGDQFTDEQVKQAKAAIQRAGGISTDASAIQYLRANKGKPAAPAAKPGQQAPRSNPLNPTQMPLDDALGGTWMSP